jgi:hypothetical protein
MLKNSVILFHITLGGQWFVFLPLDPRFVGSNPDEGDGFLREIKIRSTFSFGGEVQPSVHCRNILRYVKDPYKYERDTS